MHTSYYHSFNIHHLPVVHADSLSVCPGAYQSYSHPENLCLTFPQHRVMPCVLKHMTQPRLLRIGTEYERWPSTAGYYHTPPSVYTQSERSLWTHFIISHTHNLCWKFGWYIFFCAQSFTYRASLVHFVCSVYVLPVCVCQRVVALIQVINNERSRHRQCCDQEES